MLDDWSADLALHVIQYLSFVDSNSLALSSKRYFYLVHQFRLLRGPQMVGSIKKFRASGTTTKDMVQSGFDQLTNKPNLALAFSTLSSTLGEELPAYLPDDTVIVGVTSSNIQSCMNAELDSQSNAGLLLATMPQAQIRPFCTARRDDPSPDTLVQALKEEVDPKYGPWKVILVYAVGDASAITEPFVEDLQSQFPDCTIVGGICTAGFVSESVKDVTLEELKRLTALELLEWYRDMGGRHRSQLTGLSRAELAEKIFEMKQSKKYRCGMVEDGIFGVAMAGQVPVRSVVSRGVQSLTSRSFEPSRHLVIQDADLHRPGDPEYMFRGQDPPPYHLVRSIRDLRTDKVYTPNEMRMLYSQPDFIGLQRPNEDGFELHMPHPLSYNLNSFLFLISGASADDPSLQSLQDVHIDFFDLSRESCLHDVDETMKALQKQTTEEQVMGALMVSCAARGPSASSMLAEAMADATRFRDHFPTVPCLGFYAGGEIGPLALAGLRKDIFRKGQATLQGFTAVFALFIVPVFDLEGVHLEDTADHVQSFVLEHLNRRVSQMVES